MWLRNIGYKPRTQVACKFYTYKKLMVPGDPQRAIPIKWLMVNNEIVTFPVKKEDPRVTLEFSISIHVIPPFSSYEIKPR
jgi:hypothetical protein